jgi:hypothetical protein
MTLQDVESRDQFKAYYAEKNLQTTEAKIDNLTKTMKVRATRHEEPVTKEEILAGLEESAMLGNWKASW